MPRIWQAVAGLASMLCLFPPSGQAQIECAPFPLEAPDHPSTPPPFNVRRVAIHLNLDPALGTAHGRMTFEIRLDEPADSFALAAPLITIDSVFAGAAGRPAQPVPFRQAGRDSITVDLASLPDAGITVDSLLKLAIVFESRGLIFDDSTAWSLGTVEPWFPWPGKRGDRFTSELMLTVPSGWTVAASGIQSAERTADDGRRTYLFTSPHALPAQRIGFVAGQFDADVTFAELSGARRLAVTHEAGQPADLTADVISAASEWIDFEYPFERYFQLRRIGASPSSAAGLALVSSDEPKFVDGQNGMLPPDFTAVEGASEADFVVSPYGASSTPVEQWIGTVVSAAEWEDIWWEEALALFVGAILQGEDLDGFLSATRSRYLTEAEAYVRPLVWQRWHHPSQLFDEHASSKGAWVLHMLRLQLGEAPFRDAVAHFVEQNAFQSADTEALVRSFEAASGADLTGFADDWIYSAGHPMFNISYEAADEGVRVRIEQRQTGDFVPSVFDLELTLEVGSLEASERFSLRIDQRDEEFVLPFSGRPRYVSVDPDREWLMEANVDQSASSWIAQLRTASTTAGRLLAADTLARAESDPALLLGLRSAFASEPDPVVRARIIGAINGVASEAADRAILSAFDDTSPLVRAAVVRALPDRSYLAEAVEVATRAAQSDPSSTVQAVAVQALARLEAGNAVTIARSALITPSPNDVIRAAGLLAFRHLHPRAPGDAFTAATNYSGEDFSAQTRLAAIRLLGTLAAVNRQAAARLEGLLSDDTFHIQMAAARELTRVGAVDVLRDHMAQSSVRFRAALASIVPCE